MKIGKDKLWNTDQKRASVGGLINCNWLLLKQKILITNGRYNRG